MKLSWQEVFSIGEVHIGLMSGRMESSARNIGSSYHVPCSVDHAPCFRCFRFLYCKSHTCMTPLGLYEVRVRRRSGMVSCGRDVRMNWIRKGFIVKGPC